VLAGVDEIKQVMRDEFGIRLPVHPDLDRRLAELPAAE
jgi:hypothetical protein